MGNSGVIYLESLKRMLRNNVSIKINAIDIETILVNNIFIPICLCFSYNGKIYSFYGEKCVEECINFLFSIISFNIKHVFYIHNINFDALLLLDFFTKFSSNIEILGFDSNIYYLKVFNNSKIVEFRCSYKLIPHSLSYIAVNWLGESKLPFPYEVLNESMLDDEYVSEGMFIDEIAKKAWILMGLKNITIKDYLIMYCSNDVRLTCKFVDKLWSILLLFGIKKNAANYSLPSIALNIFFKEFNTFSISKNLKPVIDAYVRRGYYGGRCEVFGNPYHDEKVFHYDFKGMYSQCMLENFPVSNPTLKFGVDCLDVPGFYDIDWSIESNIPVLPMKDESSGKLMFFSGGGSGVYWHEEVKLHVENGGKVDKVYSALVFEETNVVFEKFVRAVEKIREKGGVYKDIGKLMVNSVYGRLGMGRNNRKTIITKDVSMVEKMSKFSVINNFIIGEIEQDKEFDGISNVIMAASITSKARIKLYKGFLDVIGNGGRLLYTDTDSIVAAFNRSVLDERHGEIFWDSKKNDTQLSKACFALPKTYAIVMKNGSEITKIKGMRRNHISFNDFELTFNRNGDVIDDRAMFIKKNDYLLKSETAIKRTALDAYSKRAWIDNKKKTLPFLHKR